MDAFFRLPAERRRILCEEGQQRLGLTPASIEKDLRPAAGGRHGYVIEELKK
jgi:hypothetical protein